jgi:hypothetical protein
VVVQPEAKPRAAAAKAKLKQAEGVLSDLEMETAILSLEAFEGRAGAQKALDIHLAKIEAAHRQVSQLKAATELAEKLDRQAIANAAVASRAEQFALFQKPMAASDKKMAEMLETAALLASQYAAFCEYRLEAAQAMPGGTSAPLIGMGPFNVYGASWSDCGRLIEAELFRTAPLRRDGAGRFVLPFATPPVHSSSDHRSLPAAIDEWSKAEAAVIAEIQRQCSDLDKRELSAATKKVA